MSKKKINCENCTKSFGSKQILKHYKTCLAEKYKEYAGHYVVSFYGYGTFGAFHYMFAIVNPETTFATIDQFLKDKWLACCGHLSTFEYDGKRISSQAIFRTYADKKIVYEYDMGSSTVVYIEDSLLIESDVAPTKSTYILPVLRNKPIQYGCYVCEGLSTHYDGNGKFLCDTHEKDTTADPEWRRIIINSPRMGESCFSGEELRDDKTYEKNVTNKRGFPEEFFVDDDEFMPPIPLQIQHGGDDPSDDDV
jgi:hypothetical protein